MIAFVAGTRPELLKLAPVWRHLPDSKLVLVRQHSELLDQHLDREPSIVVHVQRHNSLLSNLTGVLVTKIGLALDSLKPSLVVVQGDTSTAFAGALAAFYAGIPVAHVEAGLRSFTTDEPFPEEMHRKAITAMARHHFAPTELARENLVNEDAEGHIYLTGNTSVDALYDALELPCCDEVADLVPTLKNMVLVTCHRREGREARIKKLLSAIERIAKEGFSPVWITHPAVSLSAIGTGIRFLPSVDHPSLAFLLSKSVAVVTDSGGIIEEAATLGKPCFIVRNTTERQEAVNAGLARLVPDNDDLHTAFLGHFDIKPSTVYGDGHAGERIAKLLREIDDRR